MKNFKRIKTNNANSSGTAFPENVTENISSCFSEQFSELYPYSMENKLFEVYAHIFTDEILLIVSLVQEKSNQSPISFFLSKDVDASMLENPNSAKKMMDSMVELASLFFDDVLSNPEWNDYTLNWNDYTYKKVKYHLKTTRENINLTLQADELLGNEFLADLDLEEKSH